MRNTGCFGCCLMGVIILVVGCFVSGCDEQEKVEIALKVTEFRQAHRGRMPESVEEFEKWAR